MSYNAFKLITCTCGMEVLNCRMDEHIKSIEHDVYFMLLNNILLIPPLSITINNNTFTKCDTCHMYIFCHMYIHFKQYDKHITPTCHSAITSVPPNYFLGRFKCK